MPKKLAKTISCPTSRLLDDNQHNELVNFSVSNKLSRSSSIQTSRKYHKKRLIRSSSVNQNNNYSYNLSSKVVQHERIRLLKETHFTNNADNNTINRSPSINSIISFEYTENDFESYDRSCYGTVFCQWLRKYGVWILVVLLDYDGLFLLYLLKKFEFVYMVKQSKRLVLYKLVYSYNNLLTCLQE